MFTEQERHKVDGHSVVVQDRMCIQWMECSTEESEEVETAN
jgi:hypothetical protein